MIINRLIVPEGNRIRFNLEHHENDRLYKLEKGEFYYVRISEPVEPFKSREMILCDTNHFDFETGLEYGEYVFEVGIMDSQGEYTVILPAIDERFRPLNQLLILRRLAN